MDAERDDPRVYVLSPDADDKTRSAFNATQALMMACWGTIMTKLEADGTQRIILPPEFTEDFDP